MTSLAHILLGAVVMGDVLAALFFVRFWKMTGDRFFLFFSASFLAIAISRVVVDENIPPFGVEAMGYSMRILSYLFIIAGILYKNRGTRTRRTLASPPTTLSQEHLS